MGKLGLQMFMDARQKKKATDIQVTTPLAYMTGFMPLDFINGQRVRVFDDNDEIVMEYDSVGLVNGTMTTFIADPGLGKTTLSQQIAVEIASKFEESFVIHEDIEQSSHINRVYNITGAKPRWIRTHYSIFQDTHAEQIVDRFLDHAKMKLNNRKDFEYDPGIPDMYGNKQKLLIPTVVILDSLAVMRSEDATIKDEDKNMDGIDSTTNNMAGARTAKFNSEMLKQILPWAKRANIMFFVINQISRKISTGFIAPARDLVGLGDNEALSGGRSALYLSNNVVRLKNRGMLKEDKDYHINGNIISAVYYKSRTNASNVTVDLIFDKQNGFSKALTLLHFGIENGIVKKQGNKYIIPGCEDTPFAKYTFCEEACNNPMLLAKLYDLCLPKFQKFLAAADSVDLDSDDYDEDKANDSLDMLFDDDF